MGLSVDNLIQQATGSFSGSSGSVTLPAGTTAGNAVLIIVGLVGDGATDAFVNTPSGFTVLGSAASISTTRYAGNGAFLKASASAGETTWTVGRRP